MISGLLSSLDCSSGMTTALLLRQNLLQQLDIGDRYLPFLVADSLFTNQFLQAAGQCFTRNPQLLSGQADRTQAHGCTRPDAVIWFSRSSSTPSGGRFTQGVGFQIHISRLPEGSQVEFRCSDTDSAHVVRDKTHGRGADFAREARRCAISSVLARRSDVVP